MVTPRSRSPHPHDAMTPSVLAFCAALPSPPPFTGGHEWSHLDPLLRGAEAEGPTDEDEVGYDFAFVDTPDPDLVCVICSLVCRDAVETVRRLKRLRARENQKGTIGSADAHCSLMGTPCMHRLACAPSLCLPPVLLPHLLRALSRSLAAPEGRVCDLPRASGIVVGCARVRLPPPKGAGHARTVRQFGRMRVEWRDAIHVEAPP